jgi:hypothetical protein
MIRRLLSRWRLWRRARINLARRREAVAFARRGLRVVQ